MEVRLGLHLGKTLAELRSALLPGELALYAEAFRRGWWGATAEGPPPATGGDELEIVPWEIGAAILAGVS
jgi:hypothetical protein